MIRCINRLEEHQEGQIIVDGKEISENTKDIEKIRAEAGMVFQQFNLSAFINFRQLHTSSYMGKKNAKKQAEEIAMKNLEEFK